MSRTSRRRERADVGFSLVEVIVSMGLLAIVATAVLGVTVAGLRAAGAAKFSSQAKGVTQARIELMRTLPYHVGRSAGDFRDVLDNYLPDTRPPAGPVVCQSGGTNNAPAAAWSGWVAETDARCAYEPDGPFYRKVIPNVSAPGLGAFALVVDTQFLDQQTPPVAVSPPATYDSRGTTTDTPAAQQVGVTVTVVYRGGKIRKAVTSYTQIAEKSPAVPSVVSRTNSQAIRVSSSDNASAQLLLNLGIVRQDAALYSGSRVSVLAAGATGSDSSGGLVNGALISASAPADFSDRFDDKPSMSLRGGCAQICFGQTRVRAVSASTNNGLPRSGSPGSPVIASLPTNTTLNGFGFDNGSNINRLRLLNNVPAISFDLSLSNPTLKWNGCVPGPGGEESLVTSTGYLDSTDTATEHGVSSCATAQSQYISMFRTDFAPRGIVRVRLNHASAACKVSVVNGTPTATASAKYSADVSYWNGVSYTAVDTATESSDDELAGVPLTTPVALGLTLGDYISSWSTLTDPQTQQGSNTPTALTTIGGVVTIDSMPTRALSSSGGGPVDPTSVMSVQVGALTCEATDRR